eukprot:TRINITY_DN120864_c0_g1_i1.p1 TRINITY_DN120864_c0_g1~~TRINITY_DN120864_c0_g1_i1.p1  ORF type:complete len:223 (+),score=65.11 TRINITY_DN120864_c0_g1_i1:129-797(+)
MLMSPRGYMAEVSVDEVSRRRGHEGMVVAGARWKLLEWLSTTQDQREPAVGAPERLVGSEEEDEMDGKFLENISEASESTAASDSEDLARARSSLVYERALLQARAGRQMAEAARVQAYEVAETVEEALRQIDHGRRMQELGEAVRASPTWSRQLGSQSRRSSKVPAASRPPAEVARLEAQSAEEAAHEARRRAALARERAAEAAPVAPAVPAAPLPGCVRL